MVAGCVALTFAFGVLTGVLVAWMAASGRHFFAAHDVAWEQGSGF